MSVNDTTDLTIRRAQRYYNEDGLHGLVTNAAVSGFHESDESESTSAALSLWIIKKFFISMLLLRNFTFFSRSTLFSYGSCLQFSLQPWKNHIM